MFRGAKVTSNGPACEERLCNVARGSMQTSCCNVFRKAFESSNYRSLLQFVTSAKNDDEKCSRKGSYFRGKKG